MAKRYRNSIVAIAKDEDPYILEWIAYHIAIGFDHIWIYDNMSRVGVRRLLDARRSRAFVTVVDWHDTPNANVQLTAYADFVRRYKSRTAWAAVLDIDEFLCLKKHSTISEFLAGFDDATSIAVNWRYFGSSGRTERTPGLLMERFTRAADLENPINTGVKTISRTGKLAILTPHNAEHHGGNRTYSSAGKPIPNDWRTPIDRDNFDVAQVNHYFVKSSPEWDAKISRGYGWTDEDRRGLHALCDRNDCEDRAILRWKEETQRWMAALGARGPSRTTRWVRRLLKL